MVNFYFLTWFRQIGKALEEETGEGFISGRVNDIGTTAERYAVLLRSYFGSLIDGFMIK